MKRYQVIEANPTVAEFIALRKQAGWGEININIAQKSLENTLYCVCIRQSHALLAMGRVVGDGAMYFYIQDVIVTPTHQGQGVGHQIMLNIEEYLQSAAAQGATIGLLAAKDKEPFYERYGYVSRPNTLLGNGMCKFV